MMKADALDEREEKEEVPRLMAYLADSPRMFCDLWLREALGEGGKQRRLILLVDQLEELFTDRRVTDAMREQFVNALEGLARSGLVWILATVRSDYYAQFQSLGALVRMKEGSGQFDLVPPTLDALQRLIREPARMAGLRFEKRGGICLDEVMLRDAAQHAELLPLLQFVLKKLFERRVPPTVEACPAAGDPAGLGIEPASGEAVLSWAVYEELGGVEGALARTAEEAIARLKPGEATLDALLLGLVAGDGDNRDSFVRQHAPRAELERDATIAQLVAALIEERLLVSSSTAGTPVVTVAHEALLRVWPYAKGWVERNQEFIRLRDSATAFFARWKASGGDNERLLPVGPACSEGERLLELGAERLKPELRDYIQRSLEMVEKSVCRALLRAGDLKATSRHWLEPAPEFVALRDRVLTDVFAGGTVHEQRQAALLAGEIRLRNAGKDLTQLVLHNRSDAVRRAAACSLLQLQDEASWRAIAAADGGLSYASQRGLAHLLVAADLQTKDTARFDAWFGTLALDVRWRVRLLSWALRFRSAIPVFFAVMVPATFLSILAAMAFKWLPGLFNYSFGQARPSATMGVFHAVVAATLVGGGATFGLTLYRMVFGREYVRCDYLRPFGALCFGAIFGGLGGFLCNVAIAGVFVPEGLKIMGWLPLDQDQQGLLEFLRYLYFHNLVGWVFTLNGAGAGIGMGMMTNRLRTHRRWEAFLRLKARTAMSTFRQAIDVLRGLMGLSLRYAWPLPVALLVTSVIGFSILASTGAMLPEASPTWQETLAGGMLHLPSHGANGAAEETAITKLRVWKTSRFSRAVGIGCDSTAKVLGGYFAVIGMGFGIVILRSGIYVQGGRRLG